MTAALAMCRACFGYRRDEAGGPCLECGARGFTGTLSLAPPVLPRICDASQPCGSCADCDIDDADEDVPSRADLDWADAQDRARECRRGLYE